MEFQTRTVGLQRDLSLLYMQESKIERHTFGQHVKHFKPFAGKCVIL